jgi:hypothetical protein
VLTRQVSVVAAIGLAGFALFYPRLVTQTPYAALAEVLRPHLKAVPRGYPSFVARDSDVLQGYLDRSGMTFEDLADPKHRPEQDKSLKAFVFDAELELDSERALEAWLKENARDVSGSLLTVLGKDPGFRVFVRQPDVVTTTPQAQYK